MTLSTPGENVSLPATAPVTVEFSTKNFSLGGVNQPRMRVYVDADPTPHTFLNGANKTVLYNGVPSTLVEWVSATAFRINNLAQGIHTIQLRLVNAVGDELTNGEAYVARAFAVGIPFPSVPSLILVSPSADSEVPGPVLVSFVAANHVIGHTGQPHMHFYVDGATQPHEFFGGPGISEENGVQLNGAHDHLIHWKNATSMMMYGQTQGTHTLRFVLVDAQHNELSNPEATQNLSYVVAGSAGTSEFVLESVLPDANARGLAFAPDGRAFYAQGPAGNVWIVDTANGIWQQRAVPFYHTEVGTIGEQGLSGIALDPNYATNGFVYIYFTTPDTTHNRLVRVKDVNGQATEETVILDGLLAADQHNGGAIRFGPDGKLYVTVGEATQEQLSQDLTARNGKILRINGDGSIPADNPFPGSPVWAYGIRNSYGMTFHPITKDLWITENGPSVDDEVNLIVKGGNYGWPLVTGTNGAPPLINAAFVLSQPVGVTNIVALAATPVYPSTYHNNLFFTDFVGGKIRRLVLDATFKTVASNSVAFDGGEGGLIVLQQGPDGYMYTTGLNGVSRVILNPNAPH